MFTSQEGVSRGSTVHWTQRIFSLDPQIWEALTKLGDLKHLQAGRSSLTILLTKSFKPLLCSKRGDDLSLNLMSQKSHIESVSPGSSALFRHFKEKIIGKETKRERWKTSFPSKGFLGNLEIHQNSLTILVKESRS